MTNIVRNIQKLSEIPPQNAHKSLFFDPKIILNHIKQLPAANPELPKFFANFLQLTVAATGAIQIT